MAENKLNCEICFENYDEAKNKPLVLQCGHSFCGNCLDSILKSENVVCPNCRQHLHYKSVDSIPVSYALLKLLPSGKNCDIDIKSIPPMSTKPCKQHKIPQNFWCHKCRLWLCSTCALEQHNQSSGCNIFSAKEYVQLLKSSEMSQLRENQSSLSVIKNTVKYNEGELKLAEKIIFKKKQRFLQQIAEDEDRLKEIIKCQASVKETLSKIKQHETQLTSCIQELKNATDIESFDKIFKDKPSKYTNIINWSDKLGITSINNKALKDTLKSIYAQRDENGQSRWAEVRVIKGTLRVGALLEQRPPIDSKIVQFLEIYTQTPLPLVFMEIGWNKSYQGEIIIKLCENNDLAMNFLFMVMGTYGPTYKGTVFHGKRGKPFPSFIKGGDYNHGDGSGGAPVIPMIDKDCLESRTPKAGFIYGTFPIRQNTMSQFTIVYNYSEKTQVSWPIIGEVIHGIEIIREAIRSEEIVYVHNCGSIFRL